MITDEQKLSNYQTFKKYLITIIGEETFNEIIDNQLGGEEAVMNASYATKKDTGLAYEGSLIETILRLATYASDVNNLLPEEIRADKRSIYKVCLLSHLSKVIMFVPNQNQWAVDKLGAIYEFSNALLGALRFGERSTLIAMNAGVQFTPEEYEAMRYLGLRDDDDLKYYSSTLSVVIKQAYDLINLIGRNESQQKQ